MNGTDINSNQFPHVYASLGIDVNKLGVVMADTENIPVTDMVLKGEADLYRAADPARFWIRGAVAENGAHATLLYGLIVPAIKLKPQIDAVLEGWSLDSVQIEKVGIFKSPFEDEPYECVVGHLKPTKDLLEGHARLELLPHINTFSVYRPHLTLAYVKKGEGQKWVRALGNELIDKKLAVTKLNYGGDHS